MRKRVLLLLFVMLVSASLIITGCTGETEDEASGEEDIDNTENNEQNDSTDSIDYPEKPITMYVPTNPGGGTDNSLRVMAEHMKEILGEDIVIINETGGGGSLAFEEVSKANPDGYTLLYFHHQAMHTGYSTGQFEDTYEALKPIGTYSSTNQAYMVTADAPWDTLDEFVQDAKENPGKYSFGAQLSATSHFMGAMLGDVAEIELNILDVGNESDRIASMLGGQIDMTVTTTGNAAEYVDSGEFKVLATLTEERDPLTPDFPTAQEEGYDIVFPVSHILFGPKDLPDEIVQIWNEATEELANNDDYNESLANMGQEHIMGDSEEASRILKEEFEKITELGENIGF